MSRQPLSIYIASAGAGKTHNLTERYLTLALTKDFASIQAVTFTNKATEEMKERIVKELYRIAVEPLEEGGARRSDFFDKLCTTLAISPYDLRDRARATLRHILLSYGRFRVKTIDAFFQEVLRSFARELNLPSGFRLELEADLALDAAVVGVLADQDERTEEHRATQAWISDIAQELILGGEGHNLKKEVAKLASELKREPVKQLSLAGKFPSQRSLKEFKKRLAKEEHELLGEFMAVARRVMSLLAEAGISIEATSRGKSGGLAPLWKLSTSEHEARALLKKGKENLFSKTFDKIVADHTALFTQRYSGREAMVARLEALGLWRLLDEYQALVRQSYPRLSSIYAVQGLLNSYGLIAEVDRKLKEQQRSANALLLSDAPSLINAILSDGSGVQFIYEKIGTLLEHQMIDEFQDTSALQYQNFLPLLQESIASGNENLIVGDLKQSIYRFRNSDSNLLATEVRRDFEGQSEVITLRENWRSTPEIIEFNNFLFGHMPAELTTAYLEWIEDLEESNAGLDLEQACELAHSFIRYYEGHEQELPEKRQGKRGAVVIREYGALPEGETVPISLPEAIVDLQRRGYRASDIAILVRDKKEARAVSDALRYYVQEGHLEGTPYSLEVISSEALQIDTAPSVRCLIAALEYIIHPHSRQCEHLLREAYKQMAATRGDALDADGLARVLEIGRRSLYEVIEGLFAEWREVLEVGELAYQIKLLDMALSFQSNHSADVPDFLTMWRERGHRQTLVVPDDERKVRLMTVHKSKGLGFPVVLLPFPNWEFINSKGLSPTLLWCDNPLGMEEDIAQLPVKFSKELADSLFVNEYLEESVKMSLDALNLFYVATTRAKDELHIWLADPMIKGQPGKKNKYGVSDEGLPNTILGLLRPLLMKYMEQESPPSGVYWMSEWVEMDIDVRCPITSGEASTRSLPIEELHVYEAGSRIEVLREGLEHFNPNSPRVYGRLMHWILSNIHTAEDVPLALLRAEHTGLFVGQDREHYEAELMRWIESIDRPWFSPEVEVLREIPIIGGNLKTSRRPDRIVLYPDGSVDVIDYKFGQPNGAYVRQVKTYQSLITQMGYTTVRGYIWYVLQGEIVPV